MRLKNKVTIVTGVANKLAEAVAKRMASEGAKVVVTDGDKNSAEAVSNAIKGNNGEVLALEVDITSEQSTKAMAEKVVEKFGNIDILVNSAVMFPEAFQPLEKWSAEDWDNTRPPSRSRASISRKSCCILAKLCAR